MSEKIVVREGMPKEIMDGPDALAYARRSVGKTNLSFAALKKKVSPDQAGHRASPLPLPES